MIIIINAVGGRLEGEGTRSQLRSRNRRGENASVSAHTNMVAKQCPQRGKDFGVQTNGSIGDVKEMKRFQVQDEPVLVARHPVVHRKENREESLKPTKACGLASVLCDLGHRTNWE